ncbi:MAG: hypothetical protein Q9184_007785 [Pyrenodesmia sp. 2 TL-2023]
MSSSRLLAPATTSIDGDLPEVIVAQSAGESPARGRTETASRSQLGTEQLSSYTLPFSPSVSCFDPHASPHDATNAAREHGEETTMGGCGNQFGQVLPPTDRDDLSATASLNPVAAGLGGPDAFSWGYQPLYGTVSDATAMDYPAHLGLGLLDQYHNFLLALDAPGSTSTWDLSNHEQPPAKATSGSLDTPGCRTSGYLSPPHLQGGLIHHAVTQPIPSQPLVDPCAQSAGLYPFEGTVQAGNLLRHSPGPGYHGNPAHDPSSIDQPQVNTTRLSTRSQEDFVRNKDRTNPTCHQDAAPVLDSPSSLQSVPNASRKRRLCQPIEEESTDPDATENKRQRTSQTKPTFPDLKGNCRPCRQTERIRNELAQAIFELDPWEWVVEDITFALTDKRNVDFKSNPTLTVLSQPFPSAQGPEHTTFKLQDLVHQHNISGRDLLAKCDEAVLRRYGMAAATPQQALLLSHVAALRRRSPGYGLYIRSAVEGLRPVTDGLPRVHAYLHRFPLAEGQEKGFGFPSYRWYVENIKGTYTFSAQGRDGAVDALVARSLMEMYPPQPLGT